MADVFYGTDYHSHLGTKKAGMAFFNGKEFVRSIHSLESAYFRNKFEPELSKFEGSTLGMGIISDMESQPVTLISHLGKFSVVVVGRVENANELAEHFLNERKHFAELSASTINQTELVAMLINSGDTFKEGIENVYSAVRGSCSFLVLTETGIYKICVGLCLSTFVFLFSPNPKINRHATKLSDMLTNNIMKDLTLRFIFPLLSNIPIPFLLANHSIMLLAVNNAEQHFLFVHLSLSDHKTP